jgi:alcohol dehydrogenase
MPGENKGALGFNLIWLYQRADLMADLFDQVQALHLPPPHVGLVEPWERLPAALEALQGGGTVGKVVVVVDGDG